MDKSPESKRLPASTQNRVPRCLDDCCESGNMQRCREKKLDKFYNFTICDRSSLHWGSKPKAQLYCHREKRPASWLKFMFPGSTELAGVRASSSWILIVNWYMHVLQAWTLQLDPERRRTLCSAQSKYFCWSQSTVQSLMNMPGARRRCRATEMPMGPCCDASSSF